MISTFPLLTTSYLSEFHLNHLHRNSFFSEPIQTQHKLLSLKAPSLFPHNSTQFPITHICLRVECLSPTPALMFYKVKVQEHFILYPTIGKGYRDKQYTKKKNWLNEWEAWLWEAGSLSLRSQLKSGFLQVAISDSHIDPSGPLGLLLHFLT